MEIIAVKQFLVKDFHVAEAIKTLRTNILFSGTDINTIALTSFSAAEGKSSISFQLAAFLAQAGKRVVLLDADLRKSVLAHRLRAAGKVEGLVHVLSGMTSLKDALCETDIPNLRILFAGARTPNSAELLGGKNFQKLIEVLKANFDYVIVDAAPLGLVVDCAVMAPTMDGILMVVDATHNSYKMEKKVKAQLEMAGGKVLGVVLNRVDYDNRSSYYGKAYGYGGYGDYGQH